MQSPTDSCYELTRAKLRPLAPAPASCGHTAGAEAPMRTRLRSRQVNSLIFFLINIKFTD